MPSVASFPASDTTLSRTFPVLIKNSPSVESPCAKTVSLVEELRKSLPFPTVERKIRGLKLAILFESWVRLTKQIAPEVNNRAKNNRLLITNAHNGHVPYRLD